MTYIGLLQGWVIKSYNKIIIIILSLRYKSHYAEKYLKIEFLLLDWENFLAWREKN